MCRLKALYASRSRSKPDDISIVVRQHQPRKLAGCTLKLDARRRGWFSAPKIHAVVFPFLSNGTLFGLNSAVWKESSWRSRHACGVRILRHHRVSLLEAENCWERTTGQTRPFATFGEATLPDDKQNCKQLTLEEAARLGTVRKLGGVSKLNDDGTLTNECSFQKIHYTWRPVMDEVLKVYASALGSRLIGVYLRGSIPRGLAVSHISDADFIAYAFDDIDDHLPTSTSSSDTWPSLQSALEQIRCFQATGHNNFPFCKKIEMRVVLVQPGSALGGALNEHLQYFRGDFPKDQLPSKLPADLPHAFQLATQGWMPPHGISIPTS